MTPDKISALFASPPDSLHDRATVAAVLGISIAKLERDAWLGQGLPMVRIGRSVRYRKRAVEAFIAACEGASHDLWDSPSGRAASEEYRGERNRTQRIFSNGRAASKLSTRASKCLPAASVISEILRRDLGGATSSNRAGPLKLAQINVAAAW
jgi:hypothetical protein